MKHCKEDRLSQMIDEEIMRKADEREKMLMESEELQGIDMPLERLEEIEREVARRKQAVKGRIQPRVAIVLAAALVLCIGAGVVSTGSREYRPEIAERAVGDEITTKVKNSDVTPIKYDEEEVYQEIQERLGMMPVSFMYRPEGMELINYWINEEVGEAVTKYSYQDSEVQVYMSKDNVDVSINLSVDGLLSDTMEVEFLGQEVLVNERKDSLGQTYYETSFEHYNAYYFISGMMDSEEFIKILENILIKNV